MAERKPNLIERFLFGPNVNKGLEEKGLFEVPSQLVTRWGGPMFPINTIGTFGGRIDYQVEVGDLIDSSAIMICLAWLMRVFPNSIPRVVLETEDGLEPVKGHALTQLLKKPNPFYSGTHLWRSTVLSYYWEGNAYWRKVRNAGNQVIQLWYEPHWTIRPRRVSADDFVSFYEIWRGREWQRIETTDVVHFRWAMSPRDPMLGMQPLTSVLREVFTDNEAARYAAVMFRNLGVVGGLVTPKDTDTEIGDPVRLKAELAALTTGDNRGNYLVYSTPLEMQFPNSDPSKLDTRGNRKISEERISAILGVPAQVAGLGAGLDRNILGSPEEALRWAYINNIIPTQNSMAEELDIQLVNDFTNVPAETIEFDQSKITALHGDIEKKEASTANLWSVGVITRAQAKLRLGMKPATDGTDDVYRLSPLLEVALLNQGRVSPDVLEAVTEDGELKPEGQQDALTALEPPGKSTNGHLPTSHEWAALLLPEGKAKGKVDRERQAIEDDLVDEIAGELSDLYAEAEGKI